MSSLAWTSTVKIATYFWIADWLAGQTRIRQGGLDRSNGGGQGVGHSVALAHQMGLELQALLGALGQLGQAVEVVETGIMVFWGVKLYGSWP